MSDNVSEAKVTAKKDGTLVVRFRGMSLLLFCPAAQLGLFNSKRPENFYNQEHYLPATIVEATGIRPNYAELMNFSRKEICYRVDMPEDPREILNLPIDQDGTPIAYSHGSSKGKGFIDYMQPK